MDNVSKRARQMVREREKGRGKRQASTADNHGTARRVRHIDTHTQARACTGICNAVHTAQHGTHHTPDSTVHTTQHARHMHTHTHTQHTHTHTHYTALRTLHAHACALHRTMHATCTRPRPRTLSFTLAGFSSQEQAVSQPRDFKTYWMVAVFAFLLSLQSLRFFFPFSSLLLFGNG